MLMTMQTAETEGPKYSVYKMNTRRDDQNILQCVKNSREAFLSMSRSIEGRFYVHVQTTSHVIQSGHSHIVCIIF